MAKIRLAFEWLSGCSGCEMGTVDLHEKLLQVLEDVELVRLPILIDEKGYPASDVGVVTGALRTEHDVESVKALRESCAKVLALGICAVYGGPQGAGDAHTVEEICDTVYCNGPTTDTHFVPTEGLPRMLDRGVRPIDTEVEVDYYLPGCPPHPYYIAQALRAIVSGTTPEFGGHNVCFRCDRQMVKTEVSQLKRIHQLEDDPSRCWLSQGVLCMGSTALDRCLAPCPRRGIPCTGCGGPSEFVVLEPNRDIRTEIAKRMSSLTDIAEADIIKEIEHQAKTYYAYAMASPVFRQKPTFLFKRWMSNAGGSGKCAP